MNVHSGLSHIVSKLLALAFLPPDLIQIVYELIKERKFIPEMLANNSFRSFITYFETTWIYNPIFPLALWSVFDRSALDKRTTNDLEGKHRYLVDTLCITIFSGYSRILTFSFSIFNFKGCI